MVEQLNTIARLWWNWSAAMFWQVGLLIVLIACLDRFVRRWAWPQLRYALWSLVLIKLLLPPSLSLPSGIVPGLQPRIAQAVRWVDSAEPVAAQNGAAISYFGLQSADLNLDVDAPFVTAASRSQGVPNVAPAMLVTALPHDANPQSAIVNYVTPDSDPGPQLTWHVYAMAIWLAGTVILGIWLFIRLHSLAGRHAYTAAAASLPQSFYNQLAGCAKCLKLRHVPRVAMTGRLASPAVFGVFRPVLLMPKGYLSKLSRRDTEHMLLHELAHIRRGDLVMHGLYMLVQIVYWYNPLLWLARRQLHHLRELSCDATVANLLRERTPAYRQTLLETARRLLAGSVEPGLGLLGLFEDSNRLAVRLNWLTKPTWRYRTMKHVTAITVAALMLACVLPMAQAQAPASDEVKHVRSEEDNQSSEDIAALELRLQELMAQQQELQKQLQALAETRSEVRADRQMRGEAQERPRVRHVPEGLTVAPPEPRTAPGGGPPVRPEAREERIPHVQDEQQWVAQIEAWAEQLEQWEHSEEMLKWEQDMEKWGEQMGRWGQELARRQTDASADSSEMPQIAPMPALPPLPQMSTMAHVSTTPPGKMAEHAVPHPTTPRPHTAEGVTPHVTTPQIHVPHVEIPHIEMPVGAPPAIPEKEEGQEEAVSRTEHDIDLPTGRLLEVKNDMGSIAVRGSNEPGCKLVVTVKGRAETMEEARRIVEQVELVVTPSQDKVFITTTDPQSDNRQERANRVVAMEIVVPHDARVTLGQAFGDIRLAGLDGVLKAVTNMGSIRAADVRGRIALEVNFGNIDFTAPGDFSAKVQAKAQFGSIRSDLPLEIVKAAPFSMGGKAAGIIGDGQSDLSLTTNMGSIHIRKQAGESEHLF